MSRPPARPGSWAQPGEEAHVPALLAAEWRQAEAALFATALMGPEYYQQVVLAVAAVVEHLRALGPSTRNLLTAAETSGELVAEALRAKEVAATGININLLARAAFAIRSREITDEQASLSRLQALAAARRAGRSWVVLEEHGDPAGDPFAPYHRLEAEPSTGRALLISAQPDDEFRRSRHAVEVVQIDLGTGLIDRAAVEHTGLDDDSDAITREDHAAALRRALSRR